MPAHVKIFLWLVPIFLIASIVLGKFLFPGLVKMYKGANEEMADIASIQTNEIVKKKESESKGGAWF